MALATPIFGFLIRKCENFFIIITQLYLIPRNDYIRVYRKKIHWAVAKLAHCFTLFMFEMIPSMFQQHMHDVIHYMCSLKQQHNIGWAWVAMAIKIQLNRFFQLAKPNLFLLRVKCVFNSLLTWLTHWKPARE